MEGRQNFMAVEKCAADHTVQLAEGNSRKESGPGGDEGIHQHFRAVARLGDFNVLPAGTVLGPPYGGVLRPGSQVAWMQVRRRNCFLNAKEIVTL